MLNQYFSLFSEWKNQSWLKIGILDNSSFEPTIFWSWVEALSNLYFIVKAVFPKNRATNVFCFVCEGIFIVQTRSNFLKISVTV